METEGADSDTGTRTRIRTGTVLARAAAAVGIDGVFFETHPQPETSPSDGPNMVPLDALEGVLERVLRIHEARLAGEARLGGEVEPAGARS
jgi:3-deoxy-D-manno-octulosonic acid (KDO) 8-phosphate synthase